MPPLAGLAARIVAPMVANIASGLIQNVAGQSLRNLPLIGDSFQKIAGGIGQIFSGIGQLGQLLAPRGMFPPLPLPGFPGFPGGRPFNPNIFGPRWANVVININVTPQQLVQHLERLLGPNSPLMQRLNQVAETLNKILDAINRLLERMGQPTTQPGGGLYGPFFPFPPAIAATAPPGVGGFAGGVSPASGGLTGGGAVESTLGKAFDQMASILDQIGKIDPSSPQGMKQMMILQHRMQMLQQTIQMINEMRKAMHDAAMSVIRNIR